MKSVNDLLQYDENKIVLAYFCTFLKKNLNLVSEGDNLELNSVKIFEVSPRKRNWPIFA